MKLIVNDINEDDPDNFHIIIINTEFIIISWLGITMNQVLSIGYALMTSYIVIIMNITVMKMTMTIVNITKMMSSGIDDNDVYLNDI